MEESFGFFFESEGFFFESEGFFFELLIIREELYSSFFAIINI
jgi:hypothetical protein